MAPTRLKSTERDTGIVGLGEMKRLEESERMRSVGRREKGGMKTIEEMREREGRHFIAQQCGRQKQREVGSEGERLLPA